MRRVRTCALSMIIGSTDDHWHYLDQLVGAQIGPVDQREERDPSKIDKDGRRHYLIRAIPYQDPQQEAERSSWCMRRGSRSFPGFEQRRRANRSPVYGPRRCVGQLAAPTLSEPLSRFAPQRAHSSYFWPSSFHFQRQSCPSSKHLSGFLMCQSLARPGPLARVHTCWCAALKVRDPLVNSR